MNYTCYYNLVTKGPVLVLATVEESVAAVRADGKAIRFVPAELATDEMRREAVANSKDAFYLIDRELLTEDACLELVRHDGMLVRDVPKHLRTSRVVDAALENCPLVIRYMVQNENNCALAVGRCSAALKHVRPEFVTAEMCAGLAPFDEIEKYVPTEMMTYALERRIERYYERKGYVRVGPYRVNVDNCRLRDLSGSGCRHPVTMADGSLAEVERATIREWMTRHCLSHPHFAG